LSLLLIDSFLLLDSSSAVERTRLQHIAYRAAFLMPEYVYALHDFVPENADEVAFSAGERIEVIEKDELYGDGWWQVRQA